MLILFAVCAFFVSPAFAETFSEELVIRQLPDGHIYSHFTFVINRGSNESHFSLFPKSLAEVFSHYDVDELHLSVTQGLWRHRRWGYPLRSEAPPGTELWTWFQPHVSNVDQQWKRLTSALSGAFCTSLQFMDAKSTSTPRYSFRMDGVSPTKTSIDKTLVRYAALPGETPCTNTLTPWTKLLPCHTKAGLGSLLEPHSIFSASYASIGLQYVHTCHSSQQCSHPDEKLTLSLALVYNPKTNNLGNHVSLRRMFTRDIQASCILASKSKIIVDTDSFTSNVVVTPPPSNVIMTRFQEFDLAAPILFSLPFDLNIRYQKGAKRSLPSVPITVHRYLAGYGQQSGTVVCQIDNQLGDTVSVIYSQNFPWFTYLYLHTLKIVALPQNAKGGVVVKPNKLHYVPSRLRENPGLLELAFKLPPNSRTTITLDVDYQLLRWTEYPPDANHGFYINSGTITVVLPAGERSGMVANTVPREYSLFSDYLSDRSEKDNTSGLTFLLRLYTESLIVYLPTPDFSMPYNALCLVCTVVAIGFGSVHSLTTKRFVLVDPLNPPSSFIAKIKVAIEKMKSRIFGGAKDSTPTKTEVEMKNTTTTTTTTTTDQSAKKD